MPEELLPTLHNDHQETLGLIGELLRSRDHGERETLFKEMMTKLLAHAHAEQTVIYVRLMKSGDYRARAFAYEGENEHQLVEEQLQHMLRAQNKASEQWTGQLIVLRDLVRHHVEKEEADAFPRICREFDPDTLERLDQEFLREKGKQLSAA